MEAPRTNLFADPAWREVRRWPGLRGEPKLAWLRLWELAGGRPQTLKITAGEIGADQGTSDRAGRRCLESLENVGLIEKIDDSAGWWLIYLPDPLVAARARRAPGGDGQGVLFETHSDDPKHSDERIVPAPPPTLSLHEAARAGGAPVPPMPPPVPGGGSGATSAAEMAPHPPLPDLGKTSENSFYKKTSKDLGDFEFTPSRLAAPRGLRSSAPAEAAGGSGATSAERKVGVRSAEELLAGRLAALEDPASRADRGDRIERLAEWIRTQVDDPKLRMTPCLRVAERIVDGLYPRRQLERVLASLRAAVKRKPNTVRFAYFVSAIDRSMREHNGEER